MERTALRPLPTGRLTARQVAAFAAFASVAGVGDLAAMATAGRDDSGLVELDYLRTDLYAAKTPKRLACARWRRGGGDARAARGCDGRRDLYPNLAGALSASSSSGSSLTRRRSAGFIATNTPAAR